MQANSSHTLQLMAHSMPNNFKILQIQERSFQKQGATWGCAASSTRRDPLLYPKIHLAFVAGLHPTLKWQSLHSKLGTALKQKILGSPGHDSFNAVMEDHQELRCSPLLPWHFSGHTVSSSFLAQLQELELFKETAPHIQQERLVTLLPEEQQASLIRS